MTTNLELVTLDARDQSRKSRRGAANGPLGCLYASRFFSSVALQILAVMTLVEAVFLAERFPMVFRDVLKNNASLYDTALLFLLNSTQIFDLALAIAVLMAVYLTTLRMRENRELLVLFAAGTGPYQLTALVLVTALAAQIASLTVSGVIDPASRYTQRVILFDAEFRALRTGINTGQFYYFPDRVAFAPAQAKSHGKADQTRKLFVYEQVKPGSFRIITADHARLEGPDDSGAMLLTLDGFTSHMFEDTPKQAVAATPQGDTKTCNGCGNWPKGSPRMVVSANDVVQQMTMDQLLTFKPRGSQAEELTVFEQLGAGRGVVSEKQKEAMRLLGERFSRSLLCLLAPLIALAAVCLTARRTNYITLPLACMTLMSLDVASEWLIKTLGPIDPLGALTTPAIVAAVILAALLAVVVRRQGELVRPQLARS
jgi:lipopolysaccharide export LptBFGC system permease protein LptF